MAFQWQISNKFENYANILEAMNLDMYVDLHNHSNKHKCLPRYYSLLQTLQMSPNKLQTEMDFSFAKSIAVT